MRLERFLNPYSKRNLKGIKDLNVRPETVKFLEEKIHSTLFEINGSKSLSEPPLRLMDMKIKINGA